MPTLAGVPPSARTVSSCTGELNSRNETPFQSVGSRSACPDANGRRSEPSARASPLTPLPRRLSRAVAAPDPVTRSASAAWLVSLIGASIASRPWMPAAENARVAGHPPSSLPEAIASTSRLSASAEPSSYDVTTSTRNRPFETLCSSRTNAAGPYSWPLLLTDPSVVANRSGTTSPPDLSAGGVTLQPAASTAAAAIFTCSENLAVVVVIASPFHNLGCDARQQVVVGQPSQHHVMMRKTLVPIRSRVTSLSA
jgi:hypothetical protein